MERIHKEGITRKSFIIPMHWKQILPRMGIADVHSWYGEEKQCIP